MAGPATAKSLRPIVVLVRGTTSAPLFADRSCHLLTTDETGVHTSAKYDGARPLVGFDRFLETCNASSRKDG